MVSAMTKRKLTAIYSFILPTVSSLVVNISPASVKSDSRSLFPSGEL